MNTIPAQGAPGSLIRTIQEHPEVFFDIMTAVVILSTDLPIIREGGSGQSERFNKYAKILDASLRKVGKLQSPG